MIALMLAMVLASAASALAMREITFGTNGPDEIRGTGSHDDLRGLGGDDVLRALAGNDTVFGGQGRDEVYGGPGGDHLHGDSGRDNVSGGSGNDRMRGGLGNDLLDGGKGTDRVSGGAGNDAITVGLDSSSDEALGGEGDDAINAQDASKDSVSCGAGYDEVTTNSSDQAKKDTVAGDCERVFTPRPRDIQVHPAASGDDIEPRKAGVPRPGLLRFGDPDGRGHSEELTGRTATNQATLEFPPVAADNSGPWHSRRCRVSPGNGATSRAARGMGHPGPVCWWGLRT